MKKLALLHGPAITNSRKKLSGLKDTFKGNVLVFGKGTDPQTILAHLMTPTLLDGEQLIILENPPEDFVFDSSLITDHSSLIFWFDHEISEKKLLMGWLKKQSAEILFFPESREKSVFPFLDLLGNQDKKAYLELAKLRTAGFDLQYFITMVFYLLRSFINPNPKAPTFAKQKLIKQRQNFPDLAKIYQQILELDFKVKSGLLEDGQAEFQLVNTFLKEASAH